MTAWKYLEIAPSNTGVVIKSSAGVIGGLEAISGYTAASYLMLFDAASQPANGTIPIWSSASTANGIWAVLNIPPGGIQCSTGIFAGWSTTPYSYTAPAAIPPGYQNGTAAYQ